MNVNQVLSKKINKIFQTVQMNVATHQTNLKILQNIYHKSDFDEFTKCFTDSLRVILIQEFKTKNPYVERSLEFSASFCVSLKRNDGGDDDDDDDDDDDEEEEMCPFLSFIFDYVIKFHNADSEAVRYRVSQFINLLLKHLGEDGLLDDYICDNIRDAMLERIMDKKSSIRLQAVNALQRLQDPYSVDDPVINKYISCILDANSQVRKSIVVCMAPNMTSIPCLIERSRDVDKSVRLAVYDKFSKIPVKILKLEHRQTLLKNGYKDRHPSICSFISNTLIPRWLTYYNKVFFDFIRGLKLDADEKEIKQTVEILEYVINTFFSDNSLKEVFETLPIESDKLIQPDKLMWEIALFWRCLVEHIKKLDKLTDSEQVESIVPDLVEFLIYFKRFYSLQSQCKSDWEIFQHGQIMKELLKIIITYDFSDSAGKLATNNFLKEIFTEAKIPNDLLSVMIAILEKTVENPLDRSTELCMIMSDIREPLIQVEPCPNKLRERDLKIAELRVEMIIMEDQQEIAVGKQDFKLAQELKVKMAQTKEKLDVLAQEFNATTKRTTRNDPVTLCYCLDMIIAFLQSATIKTLLPTLITLNAEFIQPLLLSTIPEVHSKALKCFCLLCYLDENLASKSIKQIITPIITYKYLRSYTFSDLIISVSCISDFAMLYGSKIFGENDEQLSVSRKKKNQTRTLYDESQMETSINLPEEICFLDLVNTISEMLDDQNSEVREISAEFLTRMFTHGTVSSSQLLSKMILKWFNPVSEKDTRLRQLLGSLFIDYATNVPKSQDVIEMAFLPTIRSIILAPQNSPLVDINLDSVIKFLVELCRSERNKHKNVNTHHSLNISICNEICNKPNTKCTSYFVKTLLLLDIPFDDEYSIQVLRNQCEAMLELVKEKSIIKNIQKYIRRLDEFSDKTVDSNAQASIVTNNELVENEVTKKKSLENSEHTENQLTILDTPQRIELVENEVQNKKTKHSEHIKRPVTNKKSKKNTGLTENRVTQNKSVKRRKHTSVKSTRKMPNRNDEPMETDLSTPNEELPNMNQLVITETDSDRDNVNEEPMRRLRKRK